MNISCFLFALDLLQVMQVHLNPQSLSLWPLLAPVSLPGRVEEGMRMPVGAYPDDYHLSRTDRGKIMIIFVNMIKAINSS